MKSLVIIPAFNEAEVIASVIATVKKTLSDSDILVIDDGSSDKTAEISRDMKAIVIRHIVNLGLGGAISTGLAYAKTHLYDVAITLDADGQHDPSDALEMIRMIKNDQCDIVIGSRMIGNIDQMPHDRQILNYLANLLTFILFGARTTDSQSGFRAFNRKAITGITIKTQRMEVSSEIFAEIKRLQLRLLEIPIKVIYTPYSRAKGQQNSNKWSVGYKLMLRLFR